MKKTHYFLFFIGLLVLINSCQTSSKWIKQDEGCYKCELTNKLSTPERRRVFPFDKAETVLFIAYSNFNRWSSFIKKTTDTIRPPNEEMFIFNREEYAYADTCNDKNLVKIWNLNYKDGRKQKCCAIESIKLTQSQIDSLSNILLNFRLKTKGNVYSTVKGCYTPRNAILFLDKAENLIAFIEICFECDHIYGSHPSLDSMTSFRLCLEKILYIMA
jgi:hypothetical protein